MIDFADAECLACRLLQSEEHAPAIALKLDARYRHLLLDEFQDTNPLQWQALSTWLLEARGADRAMTVFMVGDPKQAIYRFRRGEARVFTAAADFLQTHFDAARFSTNMTRRLSPAVVQAINPVFAGIDGFAPHAHAPENEARPGALRCLPISVEKTEASAVFGLPHTETPIYYAASGHVWNRRRPRAAATTTPRRSSPGGGQPPPATWRARSPAPCRTCRWPADGSWSNWRRARPSPSGSERTEFLVAGHAGVDPKPLAKVASGGEQARISLAIAVIAATATPVSTLIFDEVDAGIGGGVAETVGRLLKQLGSDRQVLCVTHLPQVAARGDQHLVVSKVQGDDGRPVCRITRLDRKARVDEVARMLGGLQITDTTRKHAREMLAS